MSKPIDQEREAFEAFAIKVNESIGEDDDAGCSELRLDRQGGCYVCPETYAAWLAWKARASVQPAVGAVPDAQWQHIDDGDLDSAEKFINGRFDAGKCLFWPTDAYMLANMSLHCIREVRATRAAAPHPVSGDQNSEGEFVLPCDIKLPGGMTIGKGCTLSTLMLALRNRGDDMPWRQRFGVPQPFDPRLLNLIADRRAQQGEHKP